MRQSRSVRQAINARGGSFAVWRKAILRVAPRFEALLKGDAPRGKSARAGRARRGDGLTLSP
jgi:hypothetical protein